MGGVARNDYRTIYFSKTGAEIIEVSKKRRENLLVRIHDREQTLKAALERCGLTALDVMGLMSREQKHEAFSNSYVSALKSSSSARLLENKAKFGAADWDAIHGEHTRRVEELEEVANMTLIILHLKPTDEFKLTKHDLDYYEF